MPVLFDWDAAMRQWRYQVADEWMIIRQDGHGIRVMVGTYLGACPMDGHYLGLWLTFARGAENSLTGVLADLELIQALYDTTGSIEPVAT